jgi:hypothetical protein
MHPVLKSIYELMLITYVTTSPFIFLWFHKVVMKETWNMDIADRVTIRLYVMSTIAAGYMAYILQEIPSVTSHC